MAPEDLPVLTGTTPKPRFYDSEQPPNHAEKKGKGRGEKGEEKRTPGTYDFYWLLWRWLLNDKKALATHRPLHLDRAVPFSKIRVYIYIYNLLSNVLTTHGFKSVGINS